MGRKTNSSKDKNRMENLSELKMLILLKFNIFLYLADYAILLIGSRIIDNY